MLRSLLALDGVSGGIPTHERLAPLLVIKTSALSHSATRLVPEHRELRALKLRLEDGRRLQIAAALAEKDIDRLGHAAPPDAVILNQQRS